MAILARDNWHFCDFRFKCKETVCSRNLKRFYFYHFCVFSKSPSRQIYFQNQCYTMEKSELPYASIDP